MTIEKFKKIKLKKSDISLLVIDHERMSAEHIANILPEYNVIEAYSTEQGIKLFKERKPQLVLINHDMPETKGLNLLKEIKKINPNTVRIIMAYKKNVKAILKGVDSRVAYHYIWKPVHIENLKNTVRRCAVEYEAEYNQRMLIKTTNEQLNKLNQQNTKLEKKNKKLIEQEEQSTKKIISKLQQYITNLTKSLNELKQNKKSDYKLTGIHIKKIINDTEKLIAKIVKGVCAK